MPSEAAAGPGEASVVVHFGERDPSAMTLAHDVALTCFALRVEGVELLLEPTPSRRSALMPRPNEPCWLCHISGSENSPEGNI
jgi:hypothetical protein